MFTQVRITLRRLENLVMAALGAAEQARNTAPGFGSWVPVVAGASPHTTQVTGNQNLLVDTTTSSNETIRFDPNAIEGQTLTIRFLPSTTGNSVSLLAPTGQTIESPPNTFSGAATLAASGVAVFWKYQASLTRWVIIL